MFDNIQFDNFWIKKSLELQRLNSIGCRVTLNDIQKYQVLDLQSEYDYLFDETLRLEEENQLLGSYVAYSDTLY